MNWNVVVVLGPDGAGKSTLIRELARRERERGSIVDVFHTRPDFLRRRGGRAVEDPHSATLHSAWKSVAKALLWVVDCWMSLSALWVGHRMLGRGRRRVVIFDRYVHDLVVDPVRARFGAPPEVARLALRLSPRPHLLLLLQVPLKVLRERKTEVSAEETARQMEAYRALVERQGGSVLEGNQAPQVLAAEAMSLLEKGPTS